MSGGNGPAALSTVWERERKRKQEQGQVRVLIQLHRVVEETAVVNILTQRFAVAKHLFAFL